MKKFFNLRYILWSSISSAFLGVAKASGSVVSDRWSFLHDSHEFVICLLLFVGVVVFVKFRRKAVHPPPMDVGDFVKSHNFVATDLFSQPLYCNVCEDGLVEGFSCDACGVTVHPSCAKFAHKQFRCKAMSSFGPVMKHHLIKGILSE